jgi:protein RecA
MSVIMKETTVKRDEALGRALQQIEKAYGKGAIMQLDKMDAEVDGISTGALSLDLALGGKGLPRGRVVELFGPEASGKTTLALNVAAAAQRAGGIAAIVDAEHALNPGWAKKCGVNLEKLLVSQPEAGEEALEITEMLVRSGSVDVIIVDSVAALIPRAEIEGEMGDTHVALQARLMSQALRKLTAAIGKTRTKARHSPNWIDQRGRCGHRQSRAHEGGEEQGRRPIQGSRVRYHVRQRHQHGGRHSRPGHSRQHRGKKRCVVQLQQGSPGTGA